MQVGKAIYISILVSVFSFAALIFLRWFDIFDAPLYNYGIEPIVLGQQDLANLPRNLFGNLFNGIIANNHMSSSIATIIQYGIPIFMITFIVAIRTKEKETIDIKRGGSRVDSKELKNLILKDIYLNK